MRLFLRMCVVVILLVGVVACGHQGLTDSTVADRKSVV